jgi:hypothetical protein
VAQEPEGSSPHSQQPATGPCPETVETNPHPQANIPKIHSDPIFPSTPWSSQDKYTTGTESVIRNPWDQTRSGNRNISDFGMVVRGIRGQELRESIAKLISTNW